MKKLSKKLFLSKNPRRLRGNYLTKPFTASVSHKIWQEKDEADK